VLPTSFFGLFCNMRQCSAVTLCRQIWNPSTISNRSTNVVKRFLQNKIEISEGKLRDDVRMLGQILGDEIRRKEDPLVFESIEKLRVYGREWRTPTGEASFAKMIEHVEGLDNNTLLRVARGFTHFLTLSNSAENHHRIRRNHEKVFGSKDETALHHSGHSCGTVIKNLKAKGYSAQQVLDSLTQQSVEVVLTAHPTEVNRRSNLKKHEAIESLLCRHDHAETMTTYERNEVILGLQREIASLWSSDELKRSKPTPVDEAKAGLAVVESVLWTAVPQFLRRLSHDLHLHYGVHLPLTASPVIFSSWMGGDRDGNPNVTPRTTREVIMTSRWSAAMLFLQDLTKLQETLSLKAANTELLSVVGSNSQEPYRDLLRPLNERLRATVAWAHEAIGGPQSNFVIAPLKHNSELLEPLMLIHKSLCDSGEEILANGAVSDIIRRVHSFGLSLLPLDIRQESNKHSETLDAITRYLGIGSYLQWDETTRRDWIVRELGSRRPLIPRTGISSFSDSVRDTLGIFEMIASMDSSNSLQAYVISQCTQVSDILAVSLLMQDAAMNHNNPYYKPLRVVPLFETLDDLKRSITVMDQLFSIPQYRCQIDHKQEVMVGYSDSAKDAGRMSASWALYCAQEGMADVAWKHNVELTFFHGKGGTVGRGGNPALFRAILAHPPHTINGRFRITEQGEMITRNYGEIATALRTLDILSAGVLAEKYEYRPLPSPKWREIMEEVSKESCEVYRGVVRVDPRFVPYFRLATPEQELGNLNVGSRPAKRNPAGGIESLRAIPWIFSWTQTRLNLPTWLGVGESLSAQYKKNPDEINEMHANWPWFNTLIDLIDLICIKSEKRIAQYYDDQLLTDPELVQLGRELREKFDLTKDTILKISGSTELQQHNPTLKRSLLVRNPYVDPLNVIQAEILKRMRARAAQATEEEKKIMRDALLITINGIANGMRNSG
jgi:phosphoenolpyruvate carboxylase